MAATFEPFANLTELEEKARPHLSPAVYGYYSGGSERGATLHNNAAALARWHLLPRVLVDVTNVDTSCTVLGQRLSMPVIVAPMAMKRLCHPDGQRLSMPVIVAPMAMQRLCHPDGELAMARAAAACGISMCVSTMATSSLAEVAAASSAGARHLWFQMYVLTRRDVSEMMVREAEALGYTALVVTVDAPRLGKRDADVRNKFSLPSGLSLKNLERINRAAGLTKQEESEEGSAFGRHFTNLIDPSLTWDFVRWLKATSTLPVLVKATSMLPVLVKGILAPSDARRAVEVGVDGIIISNHGGRQLDTVPATIDMLPHVARAVNGRVPLLIDGSIRRGSDVVKCLALGASAVLVGRPMLWALTLGGQQGVQSALELLQGEIELDMALLGCRALGLMP
ncbi:hypothetical protein N2152v2_000378 [Parachlorella kessleri]